MDSPYTVLHSASLLPRTFLRFRVVTGSKASSCFRRRLSPDIFLSSGSDGAPWVTQYSYPGGTVSESPSISYTTLVQMLNMPCSRSSTCGTPATSSVHSARAVSLRAFVVHRLSALSTHTSTNCSSTGTEDLSAGTSPGIALALVMSWPNAALFWSMTLESTPDADATIMSDSFPPRTMPSNLSSTGSSSTGPSAGKHWSRVSSTGKIIMVARSLTAPKSAASVSTTAAPC
mmetsp:Transcript_8095/g.15376  ORF Transcript_8095/g.15376 Transcript_8095/m.15376 type:complete len:231 (-) Transcript_8095:420-1112(-)